MSDCDYCKLKDICIYEYKPCDCVHQRKFKQHPNLLVCASCDNTGYTPYPITCRECNGCGYIVDPTKPNVEEKQVEL